MLTDLGGGLSSFLFGYMSSALPAEPVEGVFDGEYVIGILGMLGGGRSGLGLKIADSPSLAVGQGTLLEQPGGGRQITIPVDASLVLTDDSFAMGLPVSMSIDLAGQIVATNALFVPEPGALWAGLVALGTLAALRRARRS